VLASKAGKAAPGLIRHGLPKVCATGEQHGTFRLHHRKTQIVAPGTRPGGKSSVTHVSGRIRGEESESCPVIARLNDRWRVVACKNNIQWILQVRRGNRWHGKYFFRTREGLVLLAREYAGEISGDALVILLRLPERFPEARP
jgi:hypothetical protein